MLPLLWHPMGSAGFFLRRLFFFAISQVGFFLVAGCTDPVSSPSEVVLNVVDVGQGLAQLVSVEGKAMAFDLGAPEGQHSWRALYTEMGEPFLEGVVISHAHWDHRGGWFDSLVAFSGKVWVHPYADTARYRRDLPGYWRERVTFLTVEQGDLLFLDERLTIRCLWPSGREALPHPLPDSLENRYSLVFRLSCGETSALLTADIDSVAGRMLAQNQGWSLKSDVLVVPHHGSGDACHPGFFGYCGPATAIISCGKDNEYGHPAASIIDLLFSIGSTITITGEQGSLCYRSNGYYWAAH